MKKKKIKNRKVILRNKRIFISSLIFSVTIIAISAGIFFYRTFRPKYYVTPLAVVSYKNTFTTINSTSDMVSQIKQMLNKENISYTNVSLNSQNTCQITLPQQQQVFLATDKDLSLQIASLQLITSRLTMEGKRFSRLDLRYDNPVITFAQ
ncbi:MAG TPA: hypothetical protein VMR41_02405 [Patescibacteria group bacterium]|nr:hypothetical protein [Patescibacteria group bacterium]